MKERETETRTVTNMAELKEMIENLPEDTVISVTMEDTKDAEKEGE